MRFLVFNSEGQANVAQRKIWAVLKRNYLKRGHSEIGEAVKRPGGGNTERWAIPRKRLDGKWVFPHPEKSMLKDDSDNGDNVEQACMNGMVFRNIEDYSPDWFASENEEDTQSATVNPGKAKELKKAG